MNLYQREMMEVPSYRPGYCVVCASGHVVSDKAVVRGISGHHVVPRSQGGTGGPVLDLCGSGTTGHHGMAEDGKLRFRPDAAMLRWEFIVTERAMKYDTTLLLDGWEAVI